MAILHYVSIKHARGLFRAFRWLLLLLGRTSALFLLGFSYPSLSDFGFRAPNFQHFRSICSCSHDVLLETLITRETQKRSIGWERQKGLDNKVVMNSFE